MSDQPTRASGFLVVRADGDMRVLRGRPRLRLDEVAFRVEVTIPTTWGKVQAAQIDVAMPEPPEARVTIGDAELDDDD